MIVTPLEGNLDQLSNYFNINTFSLHLFSNDITLADTDTIASFTEVSGGGYAPKTITGGWSGAIVNGVPQVSITVPIFTFTGPLDTPGLVRGWYLKRGTTLIIADKAPASFEPTTAGGEQHISIVYKGVNYV